MTWERVPLGEVATVSWGDTSTTKAAYSSTGHTAYSASGPDGLLPYADHTEQGVVVSAIGAKCGKTWLTSEKWSCIKNTMWFRAHGDRAFTPFLYYATADPGMWPRRGAAQPFVSLGDARAMQVTLPPLPVQHKITAVLSAYDDLIENNNRRIKTLEEMAQRIYREWFVDFRYPGHEAVPLVDSELGPIPAGWDVRSLGGVVAFHIGGGWGAGEISDSHHHFARVIRGTDIPRVRRGDMTSCPGRYHTAANVRHRILAEGDIVFEVSGGSKDQPVGRSLLINEELVDGSGTETICASFCKLVRSDRSVILPELLQFRFLDAYESGEIGVYQVQSTGITNLQFSQLLKSFPIVTPPIEIQKTFVQRVGAMISAVTLVGVQSSNLRACRDLLLPRLISGEIDVTDLDIAMPEAAA